MQKFIDKKLLKFLIVGVLNTLLGAGLMFLFYNAYHMGYWYSSALSYVLASIFSFFMNKSFTFQYKEITFFTILKFALNIAVCYVLAYTLAEPLVVKLLSMFEHSLTPKLVEQLAMLCGMGIFTVLNYFGQRLIVFRRRR